MDAWVSTYTAIAAGELSAVTGDVELVTGHPATSLAEHAARRRLGMAVPRPAARWRRATSDPASRARSVPSWPARRARCAACGPGTSARGIRQWVRCGTGSRTWARSSRTARSSSPAVRAPTSGTTPAPAISMPPPDCGSPTSGHGRDGDRGRGRRPDRAGRGLLDVRRLRGRHHRRAGRTPGRDRPGGGQQDLLHLRRVRLGRHRGEARPPVLAGGRVAGQGNRGGAAEGLPRHARRRHRAGRHPRQPRRLRRADAGRRDGRMGLGQGPAGARSSGSARRRSPPSSASPSSAPAGSTCRRTATWPRSGRSAASTTSCSSPTR